MRTRQERQQRMLQFIREYCDEHGYSPSTREISLGAGFAVHTGVVAEYLVEMRQRGEVTFVDGCNRTVRAAQ